MAQGQDGGGGAVAPERRGQARVEGRFEVHFHALEDAARALRAYSVNLSTGGLCLKVRKSYVPGAPVRITLQVAQERFEVTGVVAWVRPDAEAVGVRFTDLSEDSRARLGRLVDALGR